MTDDDTGGSVYSEFIEAALADQKAAKDSLEGRAAGVITTSGVLVTLLFGLGGLVTQRTGWKLPSSAKCPMYVALGGFAVACIVALIVTMPFRYRAVKVKTLKNRLATNWSKPRDTELLRMAATNVVLLGSYRTRNGWKAWLLFVAIAAQVVGVGALALAVAIVMKHG